MDQEIATQGRFILDGPVETMLKKLGKIKNINIEEEHIRTLKEAVRDHEKLTHRYIDCFVCVAQKLEGISENQLAIFTEPELRIFEQKLVHAARPWYWATVCSFFIVIGFLLTQFDLNDSKNRVFASYQFIHFRKILQKAYGEHWFPAQEISNILHPRIRR